MRLFKAVILLAAAAIVVFPAGVALAEPPPVNPVRDLPATVERGETFNVTVNFTAPADDFGPITVTDFAPDGWDVTVEEVWSTPDATLAKVNGNMTEIRFTALYSNGTNFTALYKVTVPCNASLPNYPFDEGNISSLAYYIGADPTHIFEDIIGDSNVTVDWPAICSTPRIDFYAAPNGTNPQNKTLKVWSSTPCWINNWSLTDDANYTGYDWLSEYPTNGSCTDVYSPVNLSVNMSGLPNGTGNYTANITINATEANNSPHTVPVTLHITTTGVLEGHVNFPGRGTPPDDRWIERFDVKLFETGNLTNVTWTGNATTDDTGVFTIPGLTAGHYDIGIKNCTCLSKLVTNVTINAGAPTEVDFGIPLEGDANDDDFVDASDYATLSFCWLSQPGDANWYAGVDFNRDGLIDASDYAALSFDWLKTGDLFGV